MTIKTTLNWIERFQQNNNWHCFRFKKLNVGYPPFDFPEHLIDEVDIQQFLLEEKDRIPLFIGSQFDVHPDTEEVLIDLKESVLVAKLDKSLLSGCVTGLSISSYRDGIFYEIEFFKN